MTGNTAVTGTLTSSGLITANAGLTVTGNVSMPGYLWAAGLISAAGAKLTSTGQVSWSVVRTPGFATGSWQVTFASAHPLGANYIVTVTAQGGTSYLSTGAYAPTSTRITIATFTNAGTLIDIPFSFMVLAS